MVKVMTVEDSNLMRSVIKNFASKAGHEVIEAASGQEAIDKYTKEKPAIVFMDIKMPGMDGFEALEKIKKIDPNAKVVMCTSLKESADEEKAKKLGAVGYIKKPFASSDIVDAIKKNT
jgi:two-component system, chemotaxis family, chemotaxis protein CheY